ALARAVSMDPATAVQGGKLSPFTQGSLVPEFEAAVFPLKVGQGSGVVKTSFGYHLIKKRSQKTLPAKPFEAVRDEIQKRLQREKFDQWVTKSQSLLGVTVDEKALASLPVAPLMPAESIPKGPNHE